LLRSLKALEDHTEKDLQQKIQQILSTQLSLEIRQALELNIHTTLSADRLGLDSSALLEAVN
jgi:acyl carrier protein